MRKRSRRGKRGERLVGGVGGEEEKK